MVGNDLQGVQQQTMTEQLESILGRLLVSDTAVVHQATNELREAFKHPEIIPLLCQLGCTSSNPQIRQYSITLVRNRLKTTKNWTRLKKPLQKSLKEGILGALVNEKEKLVRLSLSQLIGTVAQHEGENWPELMHFLKEITNSPQQEYREIGMHLLSIISENAPITTLKGFENLKHAFDKSLEEPQSGSAYYAAKSLINLALFVRPEFVQKVQPLLPGMLNLTQVLIVTDADRAVEVMELWELLLESERTLFAPYLKQVSEMCLTIAGNREMDDSLRNKALSFVGFLAMTKRKSILKLKLLQPILNTLLTCIATEDFEDDDDDTETVFMAASHALNLVALNIPSDKLMPPLLSLIEAYLQIAEVRPKRGAIIALAVIAEGCSEYIRSKHLDTFVHVVAAGIQDQEVAIRDAALFAVGQFSEHLQPDISKFANLLLPVLFTYLTQVTSVATVNTNNKGLDRLFYALEMFSETMEEKLEPHLPLLMERIVVALGPEHSIALKELALSCLEAAANATKELLVPYFPQLMVALRGFLVTEKDNEELNKLQVKALNTLGVLARTIGEATFAPLASECINFTLTLMRSRDDPDLRTVSFGLFASVSVVLKEAMSPFLMDIVEPMINALVSVEGATVHTKDEKEEALPVAEGLEDDESDDGEIDLKLVDDDDSDDIDISAEGISVENAYSEEKEQALFAIGEVALNTKSAFFPYLEKCFSEAFKLADHPHDDIRSAAISALSNLILCLSQSQPVPEEELQRWLVEVVPKLAEVIQTDVDAEVVATTLQRFAEILTGAGKAALMGPGHTEAAFNCVKEVMQKKTICQQEIGDEPEDGEEENDSQFAEELIGLAAELIPPLAAAMEPKEFSPYFEELLPMFFNFMKKCCTISERAYSIGTLAQTIHSISEILPTFAESLYATFLEAARDKETVVRNNSIYGLGELVYYTQGSLVPQYPTILTLLGETLQNEKDPMTTDTICGAIARVIETNLASVPMDQVFPVFLKSLPLRKDTEENLSVFRCFKFLYTAGHPLVKAHLNQLLDIAVKTLLEQKLHKESKNAIRYFMQAVEKDFPSEFTTFMSSVPAEAIQKIHHVISE